MIVSEVKYRRINGRLRFDAEYYQPRFLEIEEMLKRSRCVSLREIIKFSKLRRDPRDNPNKEFRYIDISNINIFTGEINFQKLKGYQAPLRARKVVKEKDIVLSTVRPNRNAVTIIPRELDSEICSTGFAVIKAEKINPYFLFVFLKTKYAIDQLVRQAMASMYPAVSEEDIGSILVPFPSSSFQQKIEFLIKKAHKKRNEANKKYKEAERLLDKILGIEDLELKEDRIFETRFLNIETNQRIDADFYKPLYIQSIKILKEGAQKGIFIVKRLGEISKVSKGIEVGSDTYTNSGKLFLRVSNLSEREIITPDSAEFIRENLYDELKDKYKPEPGEILYTKDATVGIAYPIGEDFNDFIISSGILRIKPNKEIDPYCLALTLNSIACRSQVKRHSIGVVIKHYTYSKIKDLLVPIIPLEKQKLISNLVKESFAFCEEAKRLLGKAKKEVEDFIESRNLGQREEIETNYKGTLPFLIPEGSELFKPPVQIKRKEYSMLDGSKKELVQQIGDGSIIKRFEKTSIPQKKTDVVCPHFLELKWATGCPYDCSWCYLKGTFRFLPYKTNPHIKDFDKIEKHTRTFLEYVQTPEILNTGEIADSLMLEGDKKSFVKFIVPLFESQNRHKVLLVTKSDKIKNLLKLDSHHQVIVSFSLNAIPIAQRWEKKAPSVEERIKAAKVLYNEGYEVRIRIDPMIPAENWEKLYTHLIDLIFDSFIPERITLGSLRGLQSTINGTLDKSWVKYLSEYSNWGKKIDINLRLAMYRKIISYLGERYKYHRIVLCKETLAVWEILGLNYKKMKCNCIW